ncbi:PaaI family thioesterase [Desulfococcaceae bacterium OttesenSCG-928-F15]|nr:PaaI family thioesterase [Desulfococcaceae bacterium OttesenSCG-928-F15]
MGVENKEADHLPDHLGIIVRKLEKGEVEMELPVRKCLLNPNGILHGGTIIALADSATGYGAVMSLPPDAVNFTTVELKSNFLGTAHDGTLDCTAKAVHMGKTTQVWDAVVTHRETAKTLALYRCTQLLLYR